MRTFLLGTWSAAALLMGAPGSAAGAPDAPARFRAHTIEEEIPGGYQIAVVDLNRDRRPDVIGLSGSGAELFWYENPEWKRRVITGGMRRMIAVAAEDLDGDGIPELALAAGFGQTARESVGALYRIEHRGDPRKPWKATEFDRVPTSHRLAFADIDGDGRKELINAPLTGPGAEKPDFEARTPLFFYRPGEWTRHAVFEALDGVAHGLSTARLPGFERDVVLTADFGGVWLHVLQEKGGKGEWRHERLARGDPRPRPAGGCSEIRVGRLEEKKFLATIEPWHGNQVVVYREASTGWGERNVIDDSLQDGHSLVVADFNGDGLEEIAAGYRAEGANLYLYTADDAEGDSWKRHTLDAGGMGAAGCAVGDLNGDGRVDLACIGARTANIKWYENLGP